MGKKQSLKHGLAGVLFLFAAVLFADSTDAVYIVLSQVKAADSSHLQEKGRPESFYAANKAFDGNLNTAWCEGKKDDGQEEWISAEFQPVKAGGLMILNGYASNRELYFKNNRVKDYELKVVDHKNQEFVLKGRLKDNTCGMSSAGGKMTPEEICEDQFPKDRQKQKKCVAEVKNECIMDEYQGGGEEIRFGESKCIKKITLEIKSVYKGRQFSDTCIADIRIRNSLYPIEEYKRDVCGQ